MLLISDLPACRTAEMNLCCLQAPQPVVFGCSSTNDYNSHDPPNRPVDNSEGCWGEKEKGTEHLL